MRFSTIILLLLAACLVNARYHKRSRRSYKRGNEGKRVKNHSIPSLEEEASDNNAGHHYYVPVIIDGKPIYIPPAPTGTGRMRFGQSPPFFSKVVDHNRDKEISKNDAPPLYFFNSSKSGDVDKKAQCSAKDVSNVKVKLSPKGVQKVKHFKDQSYQVVSDSDDSKHPSESCTTNKDAVSSDKDVTVEAKSDELTLSDLRSISEEENEASQSVVEVDVTVDQTKPPEGTISDATSNDFNSTDMSTIQDILKEEMHESLKQDLVNSFNSSLRSFVFNPLAAQTERFQECMTPNNESGNCRYLQHCLLPNIVSSLDQFMDFVCIIRRRFIGVCCPEFPVENVVVKWNEDVVNFTRASGNVTFPDECGVSSKTRIVGGTRADPKAWPWMAALISKSTGDFYCAGALINDRYILSAAHCTFGVRRNEIIARIGSYSLKDDENATHEDYPVVQIKRHGQYSRMTLRNDLALLKLARRVVFSEFVSTICLPQHDVNFVGQNATLAGWGNTGSGGTMNNVLMEASFPIVDNKQCSDTHRINIPPSLICTASTKEDKGGCNGDSGGPLMLLNSEDSHWTVVGIVSWGRRGCNPKFPTVYTRVTHFLNWIKKHSKK